MEARENPLHQHWGTRFKSIDEVSKEMIECKEEVDRAWKLKREEKNWWREGSNEKEVGWCLAHEDFCDMDSTCIASCRPKKEVGWCLAHGDYCAIDNTCTASCRPKQTLSAKGNSITSTELWRLKYLKISLSPFFQRHQG